MDQGSANIVLSILTLLLVVLTGFYAVQTKRMVDEMRSTRESQAQAVGEMRRAREAEIRPVLVPYTQVVEPNRHQVHLGVRNVGSGPAMAVDITLAMGKHLRFRLRCPVIGPGETRLTTVQRRGRGPDVFIPTSDDAARTLRLTGGCVDVAGLRHQFDAEAPMVDLWEHNLPKAIAGAANLELSAAIFEAYESERDPQKEV